MEHRFRTSFDIPPADSPLTLQHRILTAGSCFSDHMGEKLSEHKFPVLNNPFGVIFNPVSLFKLLQQTWSGKLPEESGMVCHGAHWKHYSLHSDFSGETETALQEKISTAFHEAGGFMHQARTLVITLGTSWVYTRQDTGEVVANCHKQPAGLFEKSLLSTEDIEKGFEPLAKLLPPKMTVILTVSPVRHERDTLPLNAVSKATLRLAGHQLSEKYPNVHYFPAYELLLDDLRDYRFYQPDMLHPSPTAVDYIWQRFRESWLDEEANAFVVKWGKIRQSLHHRPFHPSSTDHQHFLQKLLQKLEAIEEVDVSEEKKWVEGQILGQSE